MKTKTAIALFSGGLDSMLACAVARRAGVRVKALFIQTGFSAPNLDLLASRAAAAGAEFATADVAARYIEQVLFAPRYGYGKALNPCIDCHGYMFATALGLLGEFGADFVISGEVLGQRPMSQRQQALNAVKKLAGERAELIVRPLCAKLLPPSLPEREGWIDREALLDLSGRGRTRQMALAAEFGFSEYESPAGGCILTLEAFKHKALDARAHGELQTAADARILQCARHLRLPDGAKLLISRDERDGEKLLAAAAECSWLARVDLGAGAAGAVSFLGAREAVSEAGGAAGGAAGVGGGAAGVDGAAGAGATLAGTPANSSALAANLGASGEGDFAAVSAADGAAGGEAGATGAAVGKPGAVSEADLALAVSLAKAYAKNFAEQAKWRDVLSGQMRECAAPACSREKAQEYLLKG